ncbi:MAG: ribonuclease HII [Gemmatimonadales bacterium]|nr:MAG: ribonuclease HII [Gemmatimonadales bacterium]
MDAPGLEYEEAFWRRGITLVAGVDEVGRGPLAGPVVAAAVVLEPGCAIEGATDSKRLSGLRREALSREILARARFVGIGAGSVREIDGTGIAHATALAIHRALADLPTRPEHVVVDGRPLSRLRWPHEAVVKGDARIHSIACASIVAKVCRDRLMRRLHGRYPGFGWARNAGYGTREHMEALRAFGPTPHHRRSFGGVQLPLDLPDASR